MFGVEQFVAVLNPPQVAILAVGAVKETPVVVDGEIDIAPVMQLMLTCDHRAIDGADGAEFLRTLVALVEQPALALWAMVIRRGGAQDMRFLRDMLHHAYYWKERTPARVPAPLQLYVKGGGARRHGARRDRRRLSGRRGVVPALPACLPGLRLRRASDARAGDRRRPQRAWPGHRRCVADRAARRARRPGHRAISLSVDRLNAGAMRLYEKHGFERVGEDEDTLTMRALLADNASM